jgi:uncharacterized protein
MISKIRLILINIALLFVFTTASIATGAPAIPVRPPNYVVDLAGVIDDSVEAGLDRYLLELEQKTTAQIVVLTITSLDGESIFDLSLDIAHNRWKIGQKGKDNGALLLVAVNDRKYRFQIGYGLESILPDSLVGSIGRQYLVPNFRKGNYSTGIAQATLAMINIVAEDAGVEITGMPRIRARQYAYDRGRARKPTLFGSILSILFFAGLIYLFIKHPRLLMLFFIMNMFGGGRRGYWGGGGFGGGGFGGGGFSGGGGGFGGGGAGGGW